MEQVQRTTSGIILNGYNDSEASTWPSIAGHPKRIDDSEATTWPNIAEDPKRILTMFSKSFRTIDSVP